MSQTPHITPGSGSFATSSSASFSPALPETQGGADFEEVPVGAEGSGMSRSGRGRCGQFGADVGRQADQKVQFFASGRFAGAQGRHADGHRCGGVGLPVGKESVVEGAGPGPPSGRGDARHGKWPASARFFPPCRLSPLSRPGFRSRLPQHS
ncbi:hypothetical protein GCM10020000_00340 [Streptomyces olivoverticillatus]